MPKPLNIGLITAFPPGKQSLNEYGFHLAKGFAARDDVARVSVMADRIKGDPAEVVSDPKIHIDRVWSHNSPFAGPAIYRALRHNGTDAAIWNLQTATFGDREIPAALGLLTPALVRAAGYPSGVILHNIIDGIDLDQTQLKGARLRQKVVQFGGRIVTGALMRSTYATVTLSGYFDLLKPKYPRAQLEVVPHGTFESPDIEIPDFNDRPQTIVTMGKFGTYKRLETLISAFEILKRNPEHKDLSLVIGGTDHPGTPGYLEGLKSRHAGMDGLTFHGYVAEEDIPEFFTRARISVFDYTATTGSSGVLHQTASFGTVPVFPRIGDFVDLCRDEGLSGGHYEPEDATGMAEVIDCLLSDPAQAQAIATKNLKSAHGMPFADVIEYHMRKITQHLTPDSAQPRPPVSTETSRIQGIAGK